MSIQRSEEDEHVIEERELLQKQADSDLVESANGNYAGDRGEAEGAGGEAAGGEKRRSLFEKQVPIPTSAGCGGFSLRKLWAFTGQRCVCAHEMIKRVPPQLSDPPALYYSTTHRSRVPHEYCLPGPRER